MTDKETIANLRHELNSLRRLILRLVMGGVKRDHPNNIEGAEYFAEAADGAICKDWPFDE